MGPSGDPMAFGLFKDGEELFDSALEEIKRKEYDKAQKTLNKALDKNTKNADIARVYIAFISVGNDLNSPGAYDGLKNRLESIPLFDETTSAERLEDMIASFQELTVAFLCNLQNWKKAAGKEDL